MGHGRGQPDRLPLARPLARSPTRGEQGTRQVGRGHGTRATREDRPPVQPPPAWLPHPTPPRPHPLKRGGGAGGGRQKGTQTGGGTGKHEPAGTGTGGRGGARQGKAHNDDQAERPHRPGGTHAPRRGGQAQEEEEGGRRGSNEKKNPAVAPRPPGAPPASPSLPPRNLTRVCGQDAPRPTGGWKPGAQPPGATPKPRGLGGTRHRAATARGEARGGGRTPRRPAGHHRGTHPRGAATRATRPRGEPPTPTGRGVVWGGAGRGRNPRRRGGPRQGAGRTPPPPPPPRWGRAANGRRRRPGLDPPTDIARAPSRAARGLGPTPPPHPRRNTPCPKDRLRREEAPKGTAAAKANGLGASPLVRLFPLTGGARPPKASQPPPPAPSQPTPPSHTRSVKRAGGGGRAWGGVGCGADTAGGRGGAPVSALRGTKGTRRPCEDTPAAPPPERETPRGWRLIVKRRSDRRSPGRNPGPQVRSKCR